MENHLVFNWNEVPGKDSKKLLDHLEKCLKLGWVGNAEIKKSDDNKTISVTNGKNHLTLRQKDTAKLELDGGETHDYGLETNNEINVYNIEALLVLRDLDFDDDQGLENLARTISENAWKDPRIIVGLLHSKDEDDAGKARTVLLSIGDTALTPLVESVSPDIPEKYVWDMKTIINIQMETRLRIVRLLEKMLEDKRPVEMPELPPGTEEKYVPRRVCDEGYLLMRRLLAFEEGEEDRFFNADAFLQMENKERDAEIIRAKASRRWIPLTGQS